MLMQCRVESTLGLCWGESNAGVKAHWGNAGVKAVRTIHGSHTRHAHVYVNAQTNARMLTFKDDDAHGGVGRRKGGRGEDVCELDVWKAVIGQWAGKVGKVRKATCQPGMLRGKGGGDKCLPMPCLPWLWKWRVRGTEFGGQPVIQAVEQRETPGWLDMSWTEAGGTTQQASP